MIEFHFALIDKKLAIQVNVLTKDEVLYAFMIAEDEIRLEVLGCEGKCETARKTLFLIEPIIFGIWEDFRKKFPRIHSSELPLKATEISLIVRETKKKLYEELGKVIELKDNRPTLSFILYAPQGGKKSEIPFN